jgi:ribosomal protein S18 acetylase RimI-like enzyme
VSGNGSTRDRVIPATKQDDALLVPVLVRAYRDDPIMNWAFRAGPRRERAWAIYFQSMLDIYHEHRMVYTTETRRGCALWAPPGAFRISKWKEIVNAPKVLNMLGIERLGRGLAVMHRMQREHPKEPHYYLSLLAVDPDRQGRGIGTSLLRQGLAVADRDGLGAYLETANERNLSLYRRAGFSVKKSFNFGPGAPRYFLMWRDPIGSVSA